MKIKVFGDINQKSFRERGGGSRQFMSLDLVRDQLSGKKEQNDIVLIDMYNSVPELAAPIDYISTQFAALEFKFIKRQANKKEKDVSLPEFEALFYNPNPYQNNSKFLKTACIQYYLQGNVYINILKGVGLNKPSYLFLLPPQHVTPIFKQMQYNSVDPNADFRFNEVTSYQLEYGYSFNKTITAEEIIHISDSQVDFDNGKYIKGQSAAYRGIMATKAIKAGYEAKYAFYKNRGALGLFVNNDPDGVQLNPKEKDELLNNLKNKFGLKEGQHLFNYVNHNLNYLNISPDFSGLQINQNNEADTRAICKAIKGFPPSLLMDNRIALLRNEPETDRRLFKNIVVPFAYDFCEALSIGLGLSKDNIWLVPDLEKIEALKPDQQREEGILDTKQSRLERLYELRLITGDFLLESVGIEKGGYGLKPEENEG